MIERKSMTVWTTIEISNLPYALLSPFTDPILNLHLSETEPDISI